MPNPDPADAPPPPDADAAPREGGVGDGGDPIPAMAAPRGLAAVCAAVAVGSVYTVLYLMEWLRR